jgi:RNA polymerase sigma factor (sigma-70 family)
MTSSGAYSGPAIRTAYLITRSQAAAEDAVQEAFVQVLRNLGNLRDASAFRPWFYRIVVNAAKRLARRGSMPTVALDLVHHDQADATSPAPDELALSAEEAARLRAAIGELNEAHRVPVYLRYFTGLTEQEIAQALDLPQGTVKSRLYNARKMLLAHLEGNSTSRMSVGAERVTAR